MLDATNEARRYLLGGAGSPLGIGANRPASGGCDVARRLQLSSLLEVGHCDSHHDIVLAGRRGPTVVELTAGTASLPKSGYAICHQITTLDRAKLTKKIGTLSASTLHEIEDGLKAAVDLE